MNASYALCSFSFLKISSHRNFMPSSEPWLIFDTAISQALVKHSCFHLRSHLRSYGNGRMARLLSHGRRDATISRSRGSWFKLAPMHRPIMKWVNEVEQHSKIMWKLCCKLLDLCIFLSILHLSAPLYHPSFLFFRRREIPLWSRCQKDSRDNVNERLFRKI